jgi:hypothetical protein
VNPAISADLASVASLLKIPPSLLLSRSPFLISYSALKIESPHVSDGKFLHGDIKLGRHFLGLQNISRSKKL